MATSSLKTFALMQSEIEPLLLDIESRPSLADQVNAETIEKIKILSFAAQVREHAGELHKAFVQSAKRANDPMPLYILAAQAAHTLGDRLLELQSWHLARQSAGQKQLSSELASALGYDSSFAWQSAQDVQLKLRAQYIRDSYADIRTQFGAKALFRIDRAVSGYLGEAAVFPSHPNQIPKFFYIPGLGDSGLHDASKHPCAKPLAESVDLLREEFLAYQANYGIDEPYMEVASGGTMTEFVGGANPQASWDAVFFYRHGLRFEENHKRCPKTSQLLESLPLFRLEGQTPEICFSVMQPGTTIKAHSGVSNARLVMHTPLIVPEGAYLELPNVGRHFWKPGDVFLFDDTFVHLAQNPAESQRVILLMDVWNHNLHEHEIAAITALFSAIAKIEQTPSFRE